MSPQKAGVGAHRLRERIFRALDGILHLRGRNGALFPGFHLERRRLIFPKDHQTKAVHQLFRRRIHVRHRNLHRIIDEGFGRL